MIGLKDDKISEIVQTIMNTDSPVPYLKNHGTDDVERSFEDIKPFLEDCFDDNR